MSAHVDNCNRFSHKGLHICLPQCLGSIQHLKAKFGQGYSAEFRLGDAPASLLSTVEARFKQVLNGRSMIDLLSIPQLCTAIGLPQRAVEISASGTGALDMIMCSAVSVFVSDLFWHSLGLNYCFISASCFANAACSASLTRRAYILTLKSNC